MRPVSARLCTFVSAWRYLPMAGTGASAEIVLCNRGGPLRFVLVFVGVPV
jgi:hypothetical protein